MPNENAAEVLEQDGPETKDNAEELTSAAAEKAGEVDPQATENEHDDEITSPKRLGGWQRKIAKLRQENETLLEILRKGGGNAQAQQQNQQSQEAKPPVKPKAADFTGPDAWEKYEDAKDKYYEDLADFKADQKIAKFRSESQQQAKRDEMANSWAQRVAEATAKYPDFEEVAFDTDLPMSPDVAQAVIRSENGTEIAYYLGKNPKEAQRIAKMDAYDAIREIGKIESRIAAQNTAAEKEADEPPPATTRAPKPPSPVRKTTSVNQDPDDKDDYKTWLRKREAQLARK